KVYIYNPKITLFLILLGIFLFANCDNSFLDPNSTDSQSTQEQEVITLSKQEDMELVQQHQSPFPELPIEIQTYILSFLNNKDFHRAALVCKHWRNAAFILGENKTLDLSCKKLTEQDCYT